MKETLIFFKIVPLADNTIIPVSFLFIFNLYYFNFGASIEDGLVSLFNGISCRLFNAEAIFVEPIVEGIKGSYVPKSISPKVNIIV